MKQAVLVAGICGRMGGKVAELIASDPDLDLVGGVEKAEHPSAGRKLSVGRKEVRVAAGFGDNVREAGLLVDFTTPEGTMSALEFCTERGMALVTGTTGQSEGNVKTMREASRKIPLLFSPNMSVGVTLLTKALPRILGSLGGEYEIELIEKHHRAKTDCPSGTALKLAQAIATASRHGEKFQIRYGRSQGISERQRNDIFVHSIRAGDIVGEHTILLALKGERIEVKHVAESRDCFAYGTLAAIKFLLGKKAGWYTMEDVVDLPEV
jgi:4-hydroxy-tetrahydrodipicolinate reductase